VCNFYFVAIRSRLGFLELTQRTAIVHKNMWRYQISSMLTISFIINL